MLTEIKRLYDYAVKSKSSGIMVPVDELGQLLEQNKQLVEERELLVQFLTIMKFDAENASFSSLVGADNFRKYIIDRISNVLEPIQGGSHDPHE